MPTITNTAFGSRSYMATSIVTGTLTPSAVSLSFLPSIDRVRKARLSFSAAATADDYDITIEFHDDAFEEFTVTGQPKQQGG